MFYVSLCFIQLCLGNENSVSINFENAVCGRFVYLKVLSGKVENQAIELGTISFSGYEAPQNGPASAEFLEEDKSNFYCSAF